MVWFDEDTLDKLAGTKCTFPGLGKKQVQPKLNGLCLTPYVQRNNWKNTAKNRSR